MDLETQREKTETNRNNNRLWNQNLGFNDTKGKKSIKYYLP